MNNETTQTAKAALLGLLSAEGEPSEKIRALAADALYSLAQSGSCVVSPDYPFPIPDDLLDLIRASKAPRVIAREGWAEEGPYQAWPAACVKGGRGPAGYAVIIVNRWGAEKEVIGWDVHVSGPEAEVHALLLTLEHTPANAPLTITSANEITCDTFNEYMHTWAANGWRKPGGDIPKNVTLWQRVYGLASGRDAVSMVRVPKAKAALEGVRANLSAQGEMARVARQMISDTPKGDGASAPPLA